MKPLTNVLAAVLGCSLSLAAYAQQARWGKPDEATVKLIKASEKMWLDADCSPQPGLKDVFADDFQGTSPSGERYGKKDAMTTSTPLATDCRLGDVTVHFFGDTTALAYGSESSLRANAKGEVEKHCLVWTDT
ncbi:MAG: hypothetical protein JSR56_07310, partial [Proteobacteria bacterium]|nr:hypothetical protein [Pseudomonadota bacterium]